MRALFTGAPLSGQGASYHFNVWGKQGAWKNLWLTSLCLPRRTLDLSSVQRDGSHTLAKNGGAAIGYQGRKAGRTTNALFLADSQGLPLAVATPQAGNQHDTFELERVFAELCDLLEAAELRLDGLFLNAEKPLMSLPCAKPVPGAASKPTSHATGVPPTGRPMTTPRSSPNATAGGWSLSASMPGLTASGPCSYATKPACKIG